MLATVSAFSPHKPQGPGLPSICSCSPLQGRRQKMVPRVSPIFRLWNQHTQLHPLGTHSPTLADGQADAGLGGTHLCVFSSRCWVVVRSATILATSSMHAPFWKMQGPLRRPSLDPKIAPSRGDTDIPSLWGQGLARGGLGAAQGYRQGGLPGGEGIRARVLRDA